MLLPCRLAGACSGCAWIERPYAEQIEAKQNHLLAALPPRLEAERALRTVSIAAGGLRDRADLTLEAGRLGLYGSAAREILDVEACPALSPALEAWLQEFRPIARAIPIARGSVRLRVAPDGARGAWLDFANADIKALLDDRAALDALRGLGAFVEIGQRRKALVERDGRLKLGDPELRPWSETYLGDEERAAALYGPIGGFTQPGFAANRALVREARRAWLATGARRAIEFGCGNGNFTLPMRADGVAAIACESDRLACDGLALGLSRCGLTADVRCGDFHSGASVDLSEIDLIFVDPPRSGLKRFLDPLSDGPRPAHFIYVSCFAESLGHDLGRLSEMGYGLVDLALIDQFPQSPHYEAAARLRLG